MLEYCKYDHGAYTLPIWEGDTVYNETVMFVGENSAPLLYRPERIISVRSFDLKTEFCEGDDYVLKDGRIVLCENTRIPIFPLEEYYPEKPVEGHSFLSNVEGHPYIYFSEGDTIFRRQVHITYTHRDTWDRFIPQRQDKFKSFLKKLEEGDEVTVLVYGDSISTGVNSSGRIGCEPYAAPWFDMVIESLKKAFNNDRVNCINTAVGGKNTVWGLENLKERAIDIAPDLMFLGFGMNDAGRAPTDEGKLIKEMLDAFSASCPDACIALISPMLPHFRLKSFYGNQKDFEPVFSSICDEYENVGLIPVTSLHNAVLETKRYYDMTGNNVNHPNDFLARLYAQAAIKTILG